MYAYIYIWREIYYKGILLWVWRLTNSKIGSQKTGECIPKPQWDTTSHILAFSNETLVIANVNEDVEKLKPSYTLAGNINCPSHFENSLELPKKWLKLFNIELTYVPVILTHSYIFRINENTFPHKNLNMDIDSSIIHNSQRVWKQLKYPSINWRTDKQNVFINIVKYIWAYKKILSNDTSHVNDHWKHYAKPITKNHVT